jgi:putative transposase
MSRRVSPSTDQVYGLQRVTRIWGVSRATIYRHRHRSEALERRRPGPLGAMADEDLAGEIRQLLQASPFHGEGYRKLWARLRFAGLRTSRRRVLRLMREHGLLAHQRAGRPRGSRAHDGTITTERVDEMWGSDLTSVMTGEGQAAVFVAVDHCSAECVGLHASYRANRFEALEPVRQGVRERFGAFAKDIASGLALRHDHGSQYVSHHFQAEIRFLGVESSPAFVREPEGNGGACPPAGKAGPGGRAVHPGAEGESALGPSLRHDRGASPGAPRLQADLQPDLDHRTARLPDTRPGPSRPDRPPADGRVSARPCLKTVDRYTPDLIRGQAATVESEVDGLAGDR